MHIKNEVRGYPHSQEEIKRNSNHFRYLDQRRILFSV